MFLYIKNPDFPILFPVTLPHGASCGVSRIGRIIRAGRTKRHIKHEKETADITEGGTSAMSAEETDEGYSMTLRCGQNLTIFLPLTT